MADDSQDQGFGAKNENLSQFSPNFSGLPSSGNPLMDVVLSLLVGNNFAPRPIPGSTQSVYDAALMRERSQSFIRAANQGLADNMFMQRLGFTNPNGMAGNMMGFANMASGGMLANMMSPLVGGNPVLAQQRLFAGLTGMTMNTFGTIGNVSLGQTNALMNAMYRGIAPGGSINFQTTRGMQIEDITQAFTRAADTNLLGRNRSGDMTSSMTGFTQNLGAVDAARTLLGGKTGGEIVQNLSRFLGKSTFDLSNQSSSSELETLLRNVKASARVAGVSIEAIMGIINEGKQIAASHPQLRSMGGATIANIAASALTGAGVLSANMDANFVNRMGGTVGIAQQLNLGGLQAQAEPISRQLQALTFAYKDDPTKLAAIKSYINNPGSDFTSRGLNQFKTSFATKFGLNKWDVVYTASTESFADRGMLLNETANLGMDFGRVGKEAAVQNFLKRAELSVPTAERRSFRQKFAAAIAGGGSYEDALLAAGAKGQAVDVLVRHATSLGLIEQMKMDFDPEYRAARQHQNEVIRISAKTDQDIAKRLGRVNAPITQTLMQKLLSGDLDKKGLSSLLDVFKDTPEANIMNPALEAIKSALDTPNMSGLMNMIGIGNGMGGELISTDTMNALVGSNKTASDIMNSDDPKDRTAKAALIARGYGKNEAITKAYNNAGILGIKTVTKAESIILSQKAQEKAYDATIRDVRDEANQGLAAFAKDHAADVSELHKTHSDIFNGDRIDAEKLYIAMQKDPTGKLAKQFSMVDGMTKFGHIKKETEEQIASMKAAVDSAETQKKLVDQMEKLFGILGDGGIKTLLDNLTKTVQTALSQ